MTARSRLQVVKLKRNRRTLHENVANITDTIFRVDALNMVKYSLVTNLTVIGAFSTSRSHRTKKYALGSIAGANLTVIRCEISGIFREAMEDIMRRHTLNILSVKWQFNRSTDPPVWFNKQKSRTSPTHRGRTDPFRLPRLLPCGYAVRCSC